MRNRWLIVLSLVAAVVFSQVTAVGAEPNPNKDEMAVYLDGNFYGTSAIVEGSIYSANGDVEFNSATDNEVTGNIYYRNGKEFIIPAYYYPEFASRAIALDETHFSETYQDSIDFPNITNYIETHAPVWGTPVLTITENTHFGTLKIESTSSDSPLIVDTSQGDICIVVDNISWAHKKAIQISGGGRLFLFINNFLSPGPVQINNNNNPDSLYIISKTSLSHVNMNLYAHVYYIGVQNLTLPGRITGSVFTNATSLTLQGGGNAVNGLLYAPKASATIQSPSGEPNITGRLVAQSLTLTGKGRIKYNPTYATVSANTLPPVPITATPVQKHEVSVEANNPEWGTVSPSFAEVSHGETIKITATPKPGYKFTGYTSPVGSPLPDADGNLTVTGDVKLVAYFEKEETSTGVVGNYENGLLGAYYDAFEPTNESALKMRRIDDNIAFNYGYDDSPHETIERENFSIRWTGFISPEQTGNYRFMTYSDDGVRVKVDGSTVINRWGALSLSYTKSDSVIHMEAGTCYPFEMEYQQGPLYAAVYLFWEAEGVPAGLAPESAFYVSKADYNEYHSTKYYNVLEKSGTGFLNKFYAPEKFPDGDPSFTEINNINYEWYAGAPGGIETEEFYGVMEGELEARFTEGTTLVFIVDDGIRVWVEGEKVIDKWDWHSKEIFGHTFSTNVGEKYRVRIEYANFGLNASVAMCWSGNALGNGVIPREFMYVNNNN